MTFWTDWRLAACELIPFSSNNADREPTSNNVLYASAIWKGVAPDFYNLALTSWTNFGSLIRSVIDVCRGMFAGFAIIPVTICSEVGFFLVDICGTTMSRLI